MSLVASTGAVLGAAALGSGIGALGGLANAQNSYSNLNSLEESNQSWGESAWNSAEAWSKTLGSQASAQDILRAAEANELQDKYLEAQMKYNAEEAEKNRLWETLMSNTSYQRAMEDMYKSGLNPILMFNRGGASTPTGSAANVGLQQGYKAQTFADSESYSKSQGASSGGGSAKSYGRTTSNSESTTQLKSVLGAIVKSAQTYAPSSAKGFETPDKSLE